MSNTIERALEKQRRLEKEEQAEAARQRIEVQSTAPTPKSGKQPTPNSQQHEKQDPSPETEVKQTETSPQHTTIAVEASLSESTTRPNAKTAPASSALKETADHDGVDIIIDSAQLERDGMVAPTEKFAKIKEQYRYIKRPLLNNAFGDNASLLKHPNLILVSSSYPGEGKTFTAINLAISMVLEQDRTVLLVDADVINPTLSTRFTSLDKPGLLDYLKGDSSVRDIILNTNIPNFKIVTAGQRSHHSNEMIASDKMKQLMSELSERYPDRIVIFDTAPLLGASETHVLSQMVGQAVIVVEEERTTHSQLDRALSMMNPDLAVGLVLNKSKSRRRDYYGYYYAQK